MLDSESLCESCAFLEILYRNRGKFTRGVVSTLFMGSKFLYFSCTLKSFASFESVPAGEVVSLFHGKFLSFRCSSSMQSLYSQSLY
jgi:hypothetical protein